MFILADATIDSLRITPVGVVIAVLFLTSIACVLGWMLRLPKETERMRTATKAMRSVSKLTHILVPLLSKNETTDRVVALAAQMVRQRNGNVEDLAIVEVPFTLPLDAHVVDDEQATLEALECAELVAIRSAIRVKKRMLKARNSGAAIVREAEEKGVDLILMANSPVRIRGSMQQIDPAVEYVMKNAPCEVMVLSHAYTNGFSHGAEEASKKKELTSIGS